MSLKLPTISLIILLPKEVRYLSIMLSSTKKLKWHKCTQNIIFDDKIIKQLKVQSHYSVWHQRMPAYDHTLVYADIR